MRKEYVRVTIKTEKGKDSFWAYVEARGKTFNLYVPINKEADEFVRKTKKGIELTKHLVEKTAIIEERPAVISKQYGWLEVVKKPKPMRQQVLLRTTPKSSRITPKTPRLRR